MILVTGASGKVGVELTKSLRAMGRPFRAAFHSPAKAEEAKAAGTDAVTLDYARAETLAPSRASKRCFSCRRRTRSRSRRP
jgi:uncharacterized protein YbjT (DUF2867 family)